MPGSRMVRGPKEGSASWKNQEWTVQTRVGAFTGASAGKRLNSKSYRKVNRVMMRLRARISQNQRRGAPKERNHREWNNSQYKSKQKNKKRLGKRNKNKKSKINRASLLKDKLKMLRKSYSRSQRMYRPLPKARHQHNHKKLHKSAKKARQLKNLQGSRMLRSIKQQREVKKILNLFKSILLNNTGTRQNRSSQLQQKLKSNTLVNNQSSHSGYFTISRHFIKDLLLYMIQKKQCILLLSRLTFQ